MDAVTRQVRLDAPFTGGMVTDIPAHRIGARNSAFAQDGFSPQGVFRQRQGWEFDGSVADVADNLVSVARTKFILADVTRTVTGDDDGDLFIHNPAGAGTAINNPSFNTVPFLARAVYRDSFVLCADGVTPALFYSGGITDAGDIAGAATFTLGEATVTGMTLNTTPSVGGFAGVVTGLDNAMFVSPRVLKASTTALTLEDIRASATVALGSPLDVLVTALAYPAIAVYQAGTITVASDIATGFGTDWTGGSYTYQNNDSILIVPPTGSAGHGYIQEVTNGTSISVRLGNQATKSSYQITRSLPIKDAAAHKESFWCTGVEQFPSRVYVSPPGWNPAFPPGFTLPFDPAVSFSSPNANDFLLDFVDVPSAYDGDDNIAILSSPGPLLVLKRESVYGIAGSFPNFQVDLLADGIGCIDIRSAQSFDEGQFFAGETGIFWYRGGRFIDLTSQDSAGNPTPKINREWRALVRDFDYGVADHCTLGIASGHLWVTIVTGAGTTSRTYLCDLRDGSWQSRITNTVPRYYFTSRIPGEPERLLAVQNSDQGRVIDLAPCIDGSGTAADDDGTEPRLQAWSPEGLDGSASIDDDTRLLDLAISANVQDAGAAGATSVACSVVSSGSLETGAAAATTIALARIDSDTVDQVDRTYNRSVNAKGRRHQLRVDADTVGADTNATKVEIHEVTATFRDRRSRS